MFITEGIKVLDNLELQNNIKNIIKQIMIDKNTHSVKKYTISYQQIVIPIRVTFIQEDAETPCRRGVFSPLNNSIKLYVYNNSRPNDIFSTLSHELTHFLDYNIHNLNDMNKYSNINSLTNNENIKRIFNNLWIPTERNAYQTLVLRGKNDVLNYLHRIQSYIDNIKNDSNEETWQQVKNILIKKQIGNFTEKTSLGHIKNYFIKTSEKLVKKMQEHLYRNYGKYMNENIEKDEYMIGSDEDGNMGYSHVIENVLKNYLRENLETEYEAFHGTTADFNKFNHKKYLSNGAGNQSFGWGTYVTDDRVIADSYAHMKDDDYISMNGETIPINDCVKVLTQWCRDFVEREENQDFLNHFQTNEEDYIFYMIDRLTDPKVLKGFVQRYPTMNRQYQTPIARFKTDMLYYFITENNVQATKPQALLYTVDIPEDKGSNYINWYEYFPNDKMKIILTKLASLKRSYLDKMADKNYPFKGSLYDYLTHPNFNRIIDILANESDYDSFMANSFYSYKKGTDGKDIYLRLSEILGSPKAASLFLMQCGFDGIKYLSGTKWHKPQGAKEEGYNYVIFDANKVKITNKEKV